MSVDKGGRPQGSMTRNKQFLLKRLQDMYGEEFHPIMKMAENAVTLHKEAQQAVDSERVPALKASIDAWDKVAAYTEPKLKALELSGPEGGAMVIQAIEVKYE